MASRDLGRTPQPAAKERNILARGKRPAPAPQSKVSKGKRKKVAKLFGRGKVINEKAVEKIVKEMLVGTDVIAEVRSHTTISASMLNQHRPIFIEGYVVDAEAEVAKAKNGAVVSNRYAQTAILYADNKISLYNIEFAIEDDYLKRTFAEFSPKDVSSFALVKENRGIPDNKGKKQYYQVDCLEITTGAKIYSLPFYGVEFFSENPALDDLRKFIETGKK